MSWIGLCLLYLLPHVLVLLVHLIKLLLQVANLFKQFGLSFPEIIQLLVSRSLNFAQKSSKPVSLAFHCLNVLTEKRLLAISESFDFCYCRIEHLFLEIAGIFIAVNNVINEAELISVQPELKLLHEVF